jgi:hypothetical protein
MQPPKPGSQGPEAQQKFYEDAYYPYPTLIDLHSHNLIISTVWSGKTVSSNSRVSLPVYSQQKLHAFWLEGMSLMDAYSLQEFTGPLTAKSTLQWNISTTLGITFTYDYFGFPYEPWAYFTKNSYSLHTFKTGIEKRF